MEEVIRDIEKWFGCSINSELAFVMAERVGFEPTVPLPVHLISSQAHSATLPPLHQLLTKFKYSKLEGALLRDVFSSQAKGKTTVLHSQVKDSGLPQNSDSYSISESCNDLSFKSLARV